MLKWDGFNEAIIGIGERCGQDDIIVYDLQKMIKVFMDANDVDEEEAMDYISFNVLGAWIGEQTPIIVTTGPEGITHEPDGQFELPMDITIEGENDDES